MNENKMSFDNLRMELWVKEGNCYMETIDAFYKATMDCILSEGDLHCVTLSNDENNLDVREIEHEELEMYVGDDYERFINKRILGVIYLYNIDEALGMRGDEIVPYYLGHGITTPQELKEFDGKHNCLLWSYFDKKIDVYLEGLNEMERKAFKKPILEEEEVIFK